MEACLIFNCCDSKCLLIYKDTQFMSTFHHRLDCFYENTVCHCGFFKNYLSYFNFEFNHLNYRRLMVKLV